MPGEDTSGPAGIGARLRAGRERLGLTLLQAAEKLHLTAGAVEALEQDRFAELGAAVFVRGHIRRYAELVHESVPQLLELFTAAAGSLPAPDLRRVPKAIDSDVPPTGGLLLPGLGLVVGVGLVGVIWWGAHGFSGQGGRLAPTQAQPLAAEAPAPASVVAAGTESAASTAAVPITAATTAGTHAANAAAGAAPGAAPAAAIPASARTARPAAATATAAVSARPAPGSTPVRAATTPDAAGLTELTLRFAQDSWAEVYDANGERQLYDLVTGPSERALRALAPLRVVLGNAAAVTLAVDGRELTVPGRVTAGRPAQFLVDNAGHVQRTRLPAQAPVLTPAAVRMPADANAPAATATDAVNH